MTKIWAVSMRAGLVPAAMALFLAGTLAVRAEDASSRKISAENSTISVAERPKAEAPRDEEAAPAAKSAEAEPATATEKDTASAEAESGEATVDEPAKSAAKAPDSDEKSDEGKEAAAAEVEEPAVKAEAKSVPEPQPSAAEKADAGSEANPEPEQKTTDKAEAASEPNKDDELNVAKADAAETDKDEKTADAPAPNKVPSTTAALPDAAASDATDQVLPPADAIVASIRSKLPEAARGANDDDAAALVQYYEGLNGPAIWVSNEGLTDKGKAVVAEIEKADDWGLRASDFRLPRVSGSLTDDAAADAEIELAKAVLKYARYARGGRVDPKSISNLYNHRPHLRAPKAVLVEIAASAQPDAYLRAIHPQHEQFQRLRQVLLKLRGSDGQEEEEPEEDPALSVKLPPGRLLRSGMDDPQVALLRQRLKVPAADEANETLYDEELQDAVRQFQKANGLRPDAIIGNNTRAVLNGRPKPQAPSTESKISRVLINMERWRWMPEDLGDYYVWDNVPEFLTRIVKNGRVVHADKIIVGQPSWPTPLFSADMKHVVFNPQWGVPNGIKTKELWPLLRKSSGAGFFGIFGGGYSSQAVLDAYDLRVSYRGRPVDPNQVDWNSVDIRSYDFMQPPGPKNVLGTVKFMFPNKHDVYMHDTPERHLFAKSFRALSHGCMRVEEPRKLAEILLAEDKGWSPGKVRSMFGGYSNTVQLEKHIPVHVTYMTARVDDDGKLRTYGDFYGLDSRTSSALIGRSVRYEQPVYNDGPVAYDSAPQRQPPQQRKKQYSGPPTIADAINELFSP